MKFSFPYFGDRWRHNCSFVLWRAQVNELDAGAPSVQKRNKTTQFLQHYTYKPKWNFLFRALAVIILTTRSLPVISILFLNSTTAPDT